jgi:hypothetical protein
VAYVLASVGAAVLALLGFLVALTALVIASLHHFLGSAWRLWLWGSIGCTVANVLLLAVLAQFLVGIGIAGGPPPHTDLVTYVVSALVLLGPLLVSTVGIAVGCWFGARLSRRRNAQPSV